MKLRPTTLLLLGALLGGLAVVAALPKTYQFTGSVKAVDKETFSVDNGKETWTFGLNADSKGKDGMKAGDKVTVTYRMFATQIENKGAAAKPEPKAKK